MRLNSYALANTFALIDLVLHPLFHIWGWIFPSSYEKLMSQFVIGLTLNVQESFSPSFFVSWILEVVIFWSFGYIVAVVYNKLLKNDK